MDGHSDHAVLIKRRCRDPDWWSCVLLDECVQPPFTQFRDARYHETCEPCCREHGLQTFRIKLKLFALAFRYKGFLRFWLQPHRTQQGPSEKIGCTQLVFIFG